MHSLSEVALIIGVIIYSIFSQKLHLGGECCPSVHHVAEHLTSFLLCLFFWLRSLLWCMRAFIKRGSTNHWDYYLWHPLYRWPQAVTDKWWRSVQRSGGRHFSNILHYFEGSGGRSDGEVTEDTLATWFVKVLNHVAKVSSVTSPSRLSGLPSKWWKMLLKCLLSLLRHFSPHSPRSNIKYC